MNCRLPEVVEIRSVDSGWITAKNGYGINFLKEGEMKKFGVSMLVALVALGLVVMFAGCGGDDDRGLPRSEAVFEGGDSPAVIDSTTRETYEDLGEKLGDLMGQLIWDDYEYNYGYEETLEGSEGGTYRFWYDFKETYTDARDTWKFEMEEEFNDWVDNGEQINILAGDGKFYHQYDYEQTYTGTEGENGVVPEGTGEWVTYNGIWHENFASFYESGVDFEWARSGWATEEESWEAGELTDLWDIRMRADIAYNDLYNEAFLALLDFDSTLAWDGSVTTLVGSGTLCDDGYGTFDGCFDFAVDVEWDVYGDGVMPEGMPASGIVEVSSESGAAMYTYGEPLAGCYTYTVDSDLDGEFDDYEYEYCEF